MTVCIELLDTAGYEAWDAFVFSQAKASFCHRAGWKTVIEQGAGQRCPYLMATQNGAVVGILPLSIKKHPFFGKALISNMFCVYGGAIASEEDVADALYAEAWRLAEREQLPVFENRCASAAHAGKTGWVSMTAAATFKRALAADEEAQLLAIPRKQRAVVRKSLKNGLTTNWQGDLETFYDLYARSVLTLGTPVFPKKLFASLMEVFGNDVEIQLTEAKEQGAVASLMSFYFRDTVMPYYAGGSSATRTLGAHDFMYFQLMLHARERGYSVFDFGRSKVDSGPYRFKKNWGFEPELLGYEMRLADGVRAPTMSQQTGPYSTLSAAWKKLPLPVSKVLGPPLARHLG